MGCSYIGIRKSKFQNKGAGGWEVVGHFSHFSDHTPPYSFSRSSLITYCQQFLVLNKPQMQKTPLSAFFNSIHPFHAKLTRTRYVRTMIFKSKVIQKPFLSQIFLKKVIFCLYFVRGGKGYNSWNLSIFNWTNRDIMFVLAQLVKRLTLWNRPVTLYKWIVTWNFISSPL